jgi:hypothetical protein
MTRQRKSLPLPGGSKALMYPKPNHQPATFTVLNFPSASTKLMAFFSEWASSTAYPLLLKSKVREAIRVLVFSD